MTHLQQGKIHPNKLSQFTSNAKKYSIKNLKYQKALKTEKYCFQYAQNEYASHNTYILKLHLRKRFLQVNSNIHQCFQSWMNQWWEMISIQIPNKVLTRTHSHSTRSQLSNHSDLNSDNKGVRGTNMDCSYVYVTRLMRIWLMDKYNHVDPMFYTTYTEWKAENNRTV